MYRRKPAVAGAFYSARKDALAKAVDNYINNAGEQRISGEVLGVVTPHAGYIYSGPIAGYSFRIIRNSGFEIAIVLAPSHRARFDGASVIPDGIYETPLGDVEIDSEIGAKLVKKAKFSFAQEVHRVEHSLEVQVPFLQRALGDFKIVPVIIGTTDLKVCGEIADEIKEVLDEEKRKYVIVISTDLSHYHPYNSAIDIDKNFINSLKTFNEENIKDALSKRDGEACGEGPVLTGLMLCKKLGATSVEILKYGNSGDTAGDKSQVVGYLSAVFLKEVAGS